MGDRTEVELKIQRELLGIEPASERAERLASLLSYEPMLAWRLDGPIDFWNTGAERLYGFAPGEAVGRESHALLQTKFPIEFADLRSQLRNRRYWSGELRHMCKDGREVTVDSRMQLLSDDTVLEVNRDITEVRALISGQAALARELSATAAKFEALFNQSGIFAGIFGPAWVFAGSKQSIPEGVRVHKGRSFGPPVLGYAMVARFGRNESEDTVCD